MDPDPNLYEPAASMNLICRRWKGKDGEKKADEDDTADSHPTRVGHWQIRSNEAGEVNEGGQSAEGSFNFLFGLLVSS